ncbi:MAG TPA: fibronectin type III-like domain-contianing protein, partial [Anaerolinea sp.]|nr:fibronectin type III-like domain-contianing protein [Anaerolinea sp.]
LATRALDGQGALLCKVDVTNLGQVAGATVVQCYAAVPGSKVERAPKELKAFRRVELAPGETRTVEVAIPARDLAYYDPQSGWTVEAGNYRLIVGQHSLDEAALEVEFSIR